METVLEDENDEQISPLPDRNRSMDKTSTRATRFLSIIDPTSQLPNAEALMKLRQIHDQTLLSDEIPDDVLDKIPFRIEIIPDRQDEIDLEPTVLPTKTRKKETNFISRGLSDQRRLQIIEEILQKLKKTNVLNDIRQANRIPYRLPERNQIEKNVAERMRQVMGTDVVMLNDPVFIRTLCQHLDAKRRNELEKHYEQIASAAHRSDKSFVLK